MGHDAVTRTLAIEFDPNPTPRNTGEEFEWVEVAPGRHSLKRKDETLQELRDRMRKHDATNIVSEFTACAKKQMPEFNRRYGHLGVKYVEKDGTCVAVYKNRPSRLAVLDERGMVDFDEIKGGRSR